MKRAAVLITVFVMIAATALLSGCRIKESFYCEHCHQTKFDVPHYITVDTVDITVCSKCYESYRNGEWQFP